jgi:hypothetical protein
MKVIYIAGPYRAKTPWGVEKNIHKAMDLAAQLVERCHALGAYPQVPHANTAHFDGLAPDDYYLEGTLETMRRCDALLMIPGWEASSGARNEVREAKRLGLPIFYSIEELESWLMHECSPSESAPRTETPAQRL